MAKTHDSLNRRSRLTPTSTGKRVVPRVRALTWFEALHRHGSLNSSMLHAFTAHLFRDETLSKKRLRDLFHEDNTPHGGHYLIRPHQQPVYDLDSPSIKPIDLFYDITYAAELALKEAGLWHEHVPKRSNNWKHDALRAYVTANRDLVCRQHPDKFEYIYHDEIVERIKTTSFQVGEDVIIPDGFDGIRYLPSRTAILFIHEIDMNTQPLRSKSEWRHKSFEKSDRLYKRFFEERIYEEYFGKGASVMLQHTTVNARHMQNMLEVVGSSIHQLFTCVPEFGATFTSPGPRPELVFTPYLRAGKPTFDVSNP